MPYTKLRREQIDRCNICLETKKLSWDHIPPKGGIVVTPVEIRNIHKLLTGATDRRYELSPNGVKYRTICSDCNSMFGREYDHFLNDFNSTITAFLNTPLLTPQVLYVKTKPLRLIKAILGHLIAAKIAIDEVVIDKQIRELVLNIDEPIPSDINVFYWVHPYDHTVTMRDFGTLINPNDMRSFAVAHLIKYFPIAFIITDATEFRGLDSFAKFGGLAADEEAEIRVNLRRTERYDWPERPESNNMVFMSTESQKGIVARKKR